MERPRLTLKQAAAACGTSHSTMRRRREAGRFPGAVRDPDLGWLIPVDDLLAAGFRLHAPAPPDASEQSAPVSDQLAQALAELQEERRRREIAEVTARLLRDHLDDVRAAMRALTAGASGGPEHDHDQDQDDGHDQAPAVPEQARPRRWSLRRR